ncbi:SGNH/GDSL hydrolase family protein [Microlunatus sp. Y2014]|uniref:SGNH/GDSL hydrolase family protein n=1 Tax=Microlunatus sp. Y2014 TaxID=3418488 RepID=UPI003DA7013F
MIAVRMSLTGAPTMNQMAPTGQAGVDAYVSEQNADGSWTEPRFWAVARPAVDAAEYERVLLPAIPAPEHGLRMITLNLPLYLGVTEVEVGLAPESQVAAPRPFAVPGRVVFYGTSITTGGCATRPGMTYPSILGRRLDQEVINLGFPGDGKGDPEVARLLGQLDDVACHVLDYETNVLETEKVRTTLTDFIPILREARPEVPILVITKARYAREAYDAEQVRSRLERRDIQLEIVERHRAAGDEHVHFLDLGHLDMAAGTVDGLHPTDLGFTWYADAIEPKLRRILGGDTSR